MQNVTQLSVSKRPSGREDERTYPFMGSHRRFFFLLVGVCGSDLGHGSNTTLFFMLYT
ncbi:MAG: DUF3561 family protein [Symbiopectobacterium sp.]